jgi:serine/threonine-protein kinase
MIMPPSRGAIASNGGRDGGQPAGPTSTASSPPAGEARPRIGRYEILGRIGMGGMAEVFRARATGPRGYQKDLIVKRILPQFAAHPDFVRAFVDEAKILGMLYHPNIVGIYDFGEDGARHYLALEYLDGPTLGSILVELRAAGKKLPFGAVVFVAREVCRGLIAVHALQDARGRPMNVIHRDVTPSNVMTTRTGAVKLLDFGIAKIAGSDNVTRVGQIKGKAGYLAPEQILGGAVDARVDLFSLGVVLHEMLSLEPLFHGEGGDMGAVYRTLEKVIPPPSSFRADTPPDFDRVVLKALSREPAKRYQTAVEMERELDAAFEASGLSPDDVARVLEEIRGLRASPPGRPSPASPPP